MITGELKNRIDSIWEKFWTGGLTNPLDVIEQITYLMFIRDLDDVDVANSKDNMMLGLSGKSRFDGRFQCGNTEVDGKQFKWSVFRDLPAEKMYDIVSNGVFPFVKALDKGSAFSRYMADAIFKVPNAQKLAQIVDAIDDLYKFIHDIDIRGDVYEYLLSKLSTSKINGQFRTPRHIIGMIVNLMDPKPDDVVCDPACGTAGFLVATGDYLREKKKKEIFYDKARKAHFNRGMFTGYDIDATMLRIGAMNMMTHGVENPNIQYKDSLSDRNIDLGKFTLVLANPPFKGSLDAKTVSDDLLYVTNTKKTELLFIALFMRMLKTGGRCASIVPNGVLFSSSRAHKAVRKMLVDDNRLEAVISMPSGVFRPYAGVSTAVLVFTKTGHGGTDKVWFYDMQTDGFSLDDSRTPIDDNDIPDIIARFHDLKGEEARERTERSFLVPKSEIVSNDYDLSVNKYKKTVYKEEHYPSTKELIRDVRNLNRELEKNLDVLEGML